MPRSPKKSGCSLPMVLSNRLLCYKSKFLHQIYKKTLFFIHVEEQNQMIPPQKLKYEDGEILTKKEFFDILKYPCKDMLNIFRKLCLSHRAVVVDLYAENLLEKNGAILLQKKLNRNSNFLKEHNIFVLKTSAFIFNNRINSGV